MRTNRMLSCDGQSQLSIYVHIPFCVKKCYYCDFLSGVSSDEVRNNYVEALVKEIMVGGETYKDYRIATIFIGGGTPSILTKEQIKKIGDALQKSFTYIDQIEFTIEVNPGMVDEEKLETYRRMGVNRLSIGLQSAQDEELQALGRIHSYEDFLVTYHMAKKVGFTNINIDLMAALPGQDIDTYKDTLKKICRLQPTHISAYSLIIEEGTVFGGRYGGHEDYTTKESFSAQFPFEESNCVGVKKVEETLREKIYPPLPDEDTDRKMYEMTENILKKAGYSRYEISNYSHKGLECLHNTYNWQRKNYLGLGIGAASLVANKRFYNDSSLTDYISYWDGSREVLDPKEMYVLSKEEQMEEFMFLGLRLIEGISCHQFFSDFTVSIWEIYGEIIRKLEEQGLLYIDTEKNTIRLTAYGVDVSNYVLAQFLLEE